MKNLISMTDFVLEQGETSTIDTDQGDWYCMELEKLDKIRKYAKFLKQKLELWMFVPCDESGNVLEEPDINSPKYDINISEFETHVDFYMYDVDLAEYKKAKERCLFEWFKSVPFSNSVRKGNYIIDFNYTENINIESLLHRDIVF